MTVTEFQTSISSINTKLESIENILERLLMEAGMEEEIAAAQMEEKAAQRRMEEKAAQETAAEEEEEAVQRRMEEKAAKRRIATEQKKTMSYEERKAEKVEKIRKHQAANPAAIRPPTAQEVASYEAKTPEQRKDEKVQEMRERIARAAKPPATEGDRTEKGFGSLETDV